MKVVVIGATGMLAQPVIKHLTSKNFELRLFSRSVSSLRHESVQGDLFNESDLNKAIQGCDAIHINLSNMDEGVAVDKIVGVAQQHNIQLISFISGSTVSKANSWFWMIDRKLRAEQAIINSGIPYLIFRPTWFYESLDMMIRDGKATVIGKMPHEYRWIAADDYGLMVANAYEKTEVRNEILYVLGPEKYKLKDLLSEYCKVRYPEIKKVGNAPVGFLKFVSSITRNKELKVAAETFGYFERTKDEADDSKTKSLLGTNNTGFKAWLASLPKS